MSTQADRPKGVMDLAESGGQKEALELAGVVLSYWSERTFANVIRSLEEEVNELRQGKADLKPNFDHPWKGANDEAELDRQIGRLLDRIDLIRHHQHAIMNVADRLERVIAGELLWEMAARQNFISLDVLNPEPVR